MGKKDLKIEPLAKHATESRLP